jgi:hypothetical protein
MDSRTWYFDNFRFDEDQPGFIVFEARPSDGFWQTYLGPEPDDDVRPWTTEQFVAWAHDIVEA